MSTSNARNDFIDAKMDRYRGITIKNMDILPETETEFDQILKDSFE